MLKKIPVILLIVIALSMINPVSAQVLEERILIVTESHRIALGESQEGKLIISWGMPDNFIITRISAGEFSHWFGFKLPPFVLIGDELQSTGFIPYTLRPPEVYCDEVNGITLNCAEEKLYDIEIIIEGTIRNSSFGTTASIKVNIVNKQLETYFILSVIGTIGLIALIIYKMTRWKKSRSTRKTGYRKGQKIGSFTNNLEKLK